MEVDTFTLRELLEAVSKFAADNPDLLDEEVSVEGCDCVGDCAGIRWSKRYGLLLVRAEGGVTEYDGD